MRKQLTKEEMRWAIETYIEEYRPQNITVHEFALCMRTHSNRVAPIFRELVKKGVIEKWAVSIAGNAIYRAC